MLARYVLGGRLDPPYHPTKTEPNFLGRFVEVPAGQDGVVRVTRDIFTLSHDVEFVAVSMRADSISPDDYWNLYVNGEQFVKTCYCKDYPEGLYFQVAHPVAADTEFLFEFRTKHKESKKVEVLYHYLTDPDVFLEVTDQII